MKLFGYWTVLVALSISAVAAYYSIVGLVAIFASAVIPIIIMGSVLEVGKLTSAVWLHLNWKSAPFLIKTYLTIAVIMLMFITSMGIFGFLSKAHIEQTSAASENVAQIERIEESIVRNKLIITKSEDKIVKLEAVDISLDDGIQEKIRIEQQRIENAYTGVQPSIDEQNAIIVAETEAKANAIAPFETELANIIEKLALMDQYSINGEIEKMQGLLGVRQDGILGWNTREALKKFKEDNNKAKGMAGYQLNKVRDEFDDSVIKDARAEIKRIRMLAEQQIADSNALITRLRAQLGQGQQQDNTVLIDTQRNLIVDSEAKLEELYTTKYTLEGESRKLEAEVGPVKYIAELVYGQEPGRNVLEETVRYVILILVFVFDPLAVVLVLAGISGLGLRKSTKGTHEQKEKSTKYKINEDTKNVTVIKKDVVGNKKDNKSPKKPVVQNKIHEEDVVHTDSTGKEYTVDKRGNIKYLIEQLQYDLNDRSKKLQQQKKR
jgi:lysozyme family protein